MCEFLEAPGVGRVAPFRVVDEFQQLPCVPVTGEDELRVLLAGRFLQRCADGRWDLRCLERGAAGVSAMYGRIQLREPGVRVFRPDQAHRGEEPPVPGVGKQSDVRFPARMGGCGPQIAQGGPAPQVEPAVVGVGERHPPRGVAT